MSRGLYSDSCNCLVFIAGFSVALMLQNRFPTICSSAAISWLFQCRAWVLTSYIAVSICIAFGFASWAFHFRFFRSQVSRTPPVRPSNSIQNLHQVDPTCIEITADDIAKGVILYKFSGSARVIVKIGSNMVVKTGPNIDMDEAESMKFIRNYTTIPIPRVLNAYMKDGCGYILMEYVEGELLEKVWPKLLSDERRAIVAELKACVCQMRQIPCPDGTLIGSVTGGPAIDRRQLSSIKGGPFTSEAEFNEWQLAQLQPQTSLRHRDLYAATHRIDHKVVFSHGDLGLHNIIVKDGHLAAIIDWEYSGWYPEHWDYCKTMSFLSGTDEHYLFGKEILGESYHREFLMDTWFTREVRHGGF